MSLIKCRECNKEIDEKLKNCPYCGKENNLKICYECKNEIAKKAKVCPFCGAKNKQLNIKKILILLFVLFIIMICFFFFMNYYNNSYIPSDYEESYQIPGVYKSDNGFTLMLLENGTCTLSNPDFEVDQELSIYTSACNWSESNKNVYVNSTTTVTTMYGQTYNQNETMNGIFNDNYIEFDGGAIYIKQ